MSAYAIDFLVGSRRFARDLSPEQNSRLRPLVQRLYAEHKNQGDLAKLLGMKQSTLSGFLGGRQGTSFAVAMRACQLAKQNPFELLGVPQEIFEATTATHDGSPDRRADLPVGQFLMKLRRMPGLETWIEENPMMFTVSQISLAMSSYDESKPKAREDGLPLTGWEAFIRDAIRVGMRPARIEGQQESAESLETSQLGSAARRRLHSARKKR